jgi:AAA family ATP:ADP antiporter
VLFTVLPREDRYKTKNFIDTFVYRLGDQIGAWSQAALGAAGIGLVGMSWMAVPIALVWLANGMWLGRRQDKLATAASSTAPVAPVTPPADAFVAARP